MHERILKWLAEAAVHWHGELHQIWSLVSSLCQWMLVDVCHWPLDVSTLAYTALKGLWRMYGQAYGEPEGSAANVIGNHPA